MFVYHPKCVTHLPRALPAKRLFILKLFKPLLLWLIRWEMRSRILPLDFPNIRAIIVTNMDFFDACSLRN